MQKKDSGRRKLTKEELKKKGEWRVGYGLQNVSLDKIRKRRKRQKVARRLQRV